MTADADAEAKAELIELVRNSFILRHQTIDAASRAKISGEIVEVLERRVAIENKADTLAILAYLLSSFIWSQFAPDERALVYDDFVTVAVVNSALLDGAAK